MKFTLGWLKDHLDTTASLDEVVVKLTSLGLEVEDVQDRAAIYAPFKVALIEKAEKHPDADRLKVCVVDTGKEKLQVVCGAPNARTGMKGIFAPAGSVIPGSGLELKKGNIRGQESNGMMVSLREMSLSDEHEGIIEVAEDTPLGTPLAAIYGLDDPMIEINLTPNRADCTAVRGIARDLAAAGMGKLRKLNADAPKVKGKSPVGVSTSGGFGCPHFVGYYIKGVKNGPSPDWLQKRLKSIGLRPISTLVDITNLLSYDLGRPLHVYDADKLKGNIVVRNAKAGETFRALDGKDYTLTDTMVAICDDSGVLGLGGIIGGESTGCSESTVNVFLEAAYFDPLTIARAGRALQINSDARYRFERGVDPLFTATGADIAARLIVELCGGEASEPVTAGKAPEWNKTVPYSADAVEKLSGMKVDPKEQARILTALGFEMGKNDVKVPAWRGDVEVQADLVEEIIRVVGLDNLPAVSMQKEGALTEGAETQSISAARRARTALAARGFNECITWSFMPHEKARLFGSNDNQGELSMRLTNPISADLDQMRPSILPNLIEAAGRNAARGFADVALCEVGPVFKSVKNDGQMLVAAGLRSIAAGPRHWSGTESSRAVDAFDAKADVYAVLEACGGPTASAQITRDAPSWYHPGRSGVLRLGNNVLAQFGEIHPALLDQWGVKGPLVGFEVFLDRVPAAKKKGTAKSLLTLSAFQPVERDFAFVVGKDVAADAIVRSAVSADKTLIVRVDVFDVYAGKGIEDGHKSVAINVVIQPVEKTLTDAEIEALSAKIVKNVSEKTGGKIRA